MPLKLLGSAVTLTGIGSVKVYDKFSRVLREETIVINVSFLNHHPKVETQALTNQARAESAEEVKPRIACPGFKDGFQDAVLLQL
jgi:hypothetical protein